MNLTSKQLAEIFFSKSSEEKLRKNNFKVTAKIVTDDYFLAQFSNASEDAVFIIERFYTKEYKQFYFVKLIKSEKVQLLDFVYSDFIINLLDEFLKNSK